MSTRSTYLNNLTQSFRTEWSDSNIENSSVLINAVTSVWIAGRILSDVRAELQTVITLYCPPAYHMSPPEIDRIWDNSYLLLEAEVAGFCTSKSKVVSSLSTDSITFSDKWVDILLENLRDQLESHTQFDPILFIAMRLHALGGQLVVKCRYFTHATLLASFPLLIQS